MAGLALLNFPDRVASDLVEALTSEMLMFMFLYAKVKVLMYLRIGLNFLLLLARFLSNKVV